MKPNDEGYYTHVRILKTTRDKMGRAFPNMSYPAIIEMLFQRYADQQEVSA